MPNGIPSDPRQRTRNHARVEMQIWFNIPDAELLEEGEHSAYDLLRREVDRIEGLVKEDKMMMVNEKNIGIFLIRKNVFFFSGMNM